MFCIISEYLIVGTINKNIENYLFHYKISNSKSTLYFHAHCQSFPHIFFTTMKALYRKANFGF